MVKIVSKRGRDAVKKREPYFDAFGPLNFDFSLEDSDDYVIVEILPEQLEFDFHNQDFTRSPSSGD